MNAAMRTGHTGANAPVRHARRNALPLSRGRTAAQAAASPSAMPSFIPAEVSELQEPAALSMAAAYRRVPLPVPSLGPAWLPTAFVGPSAEQAQRYDAGAAPIVLLHGFDSSSLEMRRLQPLLAERHPTYAVDLVGWGFTDNTQFGANPQRVIGPVDKRQHLYEFWRWVAGRGGQPMVLVGASLGGAVAIDFALQHPEAVSKLVLIDAQGFIDGIGMMAELPRPLASLGVSVLRTEWLRQAANKMAYYDKAKFATDDARRVGRLHTFMPGWQDANVAFMKGGGYRIVDRIASVKQETLVLWGRNDEILDPKLYAERFEATIPNAKLVWVESCGHCPHLEQPQFTAQRILELAAGASAETAAGVEATSVARSAASKTASGVVKTAVTVSA